MIDTHDYRRKIKESFSWSSKAGYPVQAGISNTSKVQVQVQLFRPRWDFKYIKSPNPSPVIPSKLRFQIHQKSKSKSSYPVQDGISNKSEDKIFISRSVNLSLGMLIKDVGQVTTVPGEGFGRRLNASGVVPLTSL